MARGETFGRFETEMIAAVVGDIHRMIKEDYVTDAFEKTFDFIRDFTAQSPDHKKLTRTALQLSARHARQQKAKRYNLPEPEPSEKILEDLMALVDRVEEIARIPTSPDLSAQDAAAVASDANAQMETVKTDAGYDPTRMKQLLISLTQARAPVERRLVAKLDGIERTYARGGFKLGPVTAEFIDGEITGVVGMNASGKTTMLRILLGELAPDAGVASYPAITANARDWVEIKSRLAYVPQLPPPWPGRQRTNLNFTAAAYGLTGPENDELVDWYLHRYGLKPYENAGWDEISGGFKIRFELVRALLMRPRLLVLDEPLAYLDIVTQQMFLEDLRSLATSVERPIPIVITSQHLYEVEAIAQRMIILDNGQCVYSGRLDELPSAREFFMYEVEIDAEKSALLERLRPVGLMDLEPTTLGWILIFKKTEPGVIERALLEQFPGALKYFRNISHSTRVLFRSHRDSGDRRMTA